MFKCPFFFLLDKKELFKPFGYKGKFTSQSGQKSQIPQRRLWERIDFLYKERERIYDKERNKSRGIEKKGANMGKENDPGEIRTLKCLAREKGVSLEANKSGPSKRNHGALTLNKGEPEGCHDAKKNKTLAIGK